MLSLKRQWFPLVVALLVLLIGFEGIIAQDADDEFVPSPALVLQLESIEQSTSLIRGLEPLQPVDRFFPDRDDLRAYLESNLEGEDNERLFEEAQHFYVAFGFMDPDIELKRIYTELLNSQVAGYYDTETREMNTVLMSGSRPGNSLPVLERITYAHEYTHALQDQHFDLENFISDELSEVNPDEAQARISLIEGDASLVMNEYTAQLAEESPLLLLMQIGVLALGGTTAVPEGTPDILMDELMSPYVDGLKFVEALVAEGGYERVNEAYRNPPVSTEQILHPDRYLAGDMPIEVTLVDVTPDAVANWELVYERSLGEFYLRQYLDRHLGALDALRASTGWGGDRYRIYYNPETEARAFILKVVWDTEKDADEFASAFVQFGELGYETDADTDGCWIGDDVVCFAQMDDASFVSSAADKDVALALLTAQLEPQPA